MASPEPATVKPSYSISAIHRDPSVFTRTIRVDVSTTKVFKSWILSKLGEVSFSRRCYRMQNPTHFTRIQHGPYAIEQSNAYTSLSHRRRFMFLISNSAFLALWYWYVVRQIYFIHFLQKGYGASWQLWSALAAEVFLSLQELILVFNILIPLLRPGKLKVRPHFRLTGSSAPTVDICITCCGEPMDIILNTVAAAASQDYPARKFRIVVLDDGNDPALKSSVKALARKVLSRNGPQIHYRARTVMARDQSFYKSGNLQFGINELRKLGHSEYFANLDYDMIATPDWLRIILPHLIIDPEMALVNPPQNYYNLPDDDPLGQQTDLDVFFSLYEPLNDSLGAARCMGTGFIVRHSALADIGGWPLIDVGEDFMLSSQLSNAGWKTAFVPEALQLGLAPDSLRAHIKQKTRWVDGALEVHKSFNFYAPGRGVHLRLAQRLIFILQTLREYTPIPTIVGMLLLPLSFLCMGSALSTANVETTAIVYRSQGCYFFLAIYVGRKVNDRIVYGHIESSRLRSLRSQEIWSAAYSAVRCWLSFLPSSTRRLIFDPSGAIKSNINERRPSRADVSRRLLQQSLIWHYFYLLYATSPFIMAIQKSSASGRRQLFDMCRLPGPLLMLVSCIWKTSALLWYLAFPPTVAEWTELTEEDDQGVRRPKTKIISTNNSRLHLSWFEAFEFLLVGIIVFAG